MELTGMHRSSGTPLSGIAHLQQSIKDILTTPLSSRRMRPEYGSELPRYVDLPINRGWISAVQAEAARAISRWEPRLKLTAVQVEAIIEGSIHFNIRGHYAAAPIVLVMAW